MATKEPDKSKLLIYLPKGLASDLRVYVAKQKAAMDRPSGASISSIIEQAVRAWMKDHKHK